MLIHSWFFTPAMVEMSLHDTDQIAHKTWVIYYLPTPDTGVYKMMGKKCRTHQGNMLPDAMTVLPSLLILIQTPGYSDHHFSSPGLLPVSQPQPMNWAQRDSAFKEFTAQSGAVKYDLGENGVDTKFTQREEENQKIIESILYHKYVQEWSLMTEL